MEWDYNSAMFHPHCRDRATLPYGHNKRLHAWFSLTYMNGQTFCSEKGDTGQTSAGIFWGIATGNDKEVPE